MEKAHNKIINTSRVYWYNLRQRKKDNMSYKLNKRGKALAYIILFILAYVFSGMLVDSFLSEQEQLRVKSEQLQEQINNMKH